MDDLGVPPFWEIPISYSTIVMITFDDSHQSFTGYENYRKVGNPMNNDGQ